ncbi:MAG: hypothetical protein KDK28_05515 [Maritimibacter sp.]|nr:hypothetical protein [Maritimibacter sp.]
MKSAKKTFLVFLVCLVTLWPVARSVATATGLFHVTAAQQSRAPTSLR